MKVALCTEILYPLYGVERRVYEFALRLPKYGIDVEVFTSTSPDRFPELNITQVSHETITAPPKRNYAFCTAYVVNLFRRLMKSDYDVIHAEGHMSLIPCSLAAKMRKKPSIATVHDLYLAEWRKMYRGKAGFAGVPFEVLSCKMPYDRILTVNSALREKMEKILHMKNLEIRHSGIDTNYIRSVKPKEKDNSIVYMGRLAPQKSVGTLIRAYALLPLELRRSHPLKIMGDGSERGKLEKLAKDLGIVVNFTGHIKEHEQMLSELKAGSLFALPSTRESFGITIMEAMCSGIPVVSTATEGPADHIKNGETGFLTEIGNHKEMAEKMELILTNDSLRKKIIANGSRVAEQHDWEIITKRIVGIYREVMEK
jgi:glycosyltransferase involved in cell wall biosynthesis